MGHEAVIYRNKIQQHSEEAQIVDQEDVINFLWSIASLAVIQVRASLLTVVVLTI